MKKIVPEKLYEVKHGLKPLKHKPCFYFVVKNDFPEYIGTYKMSPRGWGNGYVAINPNHPLFGKDYEDGLELDVHGGITYADYGKNLVGSVPELIGYENWWVLGFDTNHFSDTPERWPKERVIEEAKSLLEQIEFLGES